VLCRPVRTLWTNLIEVGESRIVKRDTPMGLSAEVKKNLPVSGLASCKLRATEEREIHVNHRLPVELEVVVWLFVGHLGGRAKRACSSAMLGSVVCA
jgi:hypothetical protein